MLRSVTILAVSLLGVGKLITSSIAGLRPLIGGKPGRAGFNVKVANATDTGFWNMLRLFEPIEEKVLFAVPNHRRNIYGEARIRASGLNCCVVVMAKHETEVEETLKMGIPSFKLYR